MLSWILQKDPEKRPTALDIVENDWLTKNGLDLIELDLESVSDFTS